jgi:transcriptional antiterminator RfaH
MRRAHPNKYCPCTEGYDAAAFRARLRTGIWLDDDTHLGILEMQEISSPAWYCARTQPKHEHIAAANLTRNLGLEVFHPRLRMERATCRGAVRVIEPLFPCYVFVRCESDQFDEIRYVSGISSLVHFGRKIPIVPDLVIDELKQCFETEEPMDVEDRLYPGAEVTVAEGSFLGFSGIVLRVLPARRRVQILLDFLGRTTLAEVDRNSLTLETSCVADLMPSLATTPRLTVAASGW